jgi:hypothetical protein
VALAFWPIVRQVGVIRAKSFFISRHIIIEILDGFFRKADKWFPLVFLFA